MPPAADLLYSKGFKLSTGGHAAYERYSVSGLTSVDDLTPAVAAGLPKIGDTKTFGLGSSYTLSVAAVEAEEIQTTTARFVGVHYRSNFGYAGYTHAISNGPTRSSETIRLENWTGVSGSGTWKPIIIPIKRGVIYVLKTNFVSLSPSVVELFLQLNFNKSYAINGVQMILHGIKSLQSNSSALLIETTFRAEMPVLAYPVHYFGAQQSISIPALDYNDEYIVTPPNDRLTGSAGDPLITIKTQAQIYNVGDPFPWTL